jgi:hypothetical protein
MSFLVAVVSPIASYLWWNRDWWQPPSFFSIGGVSMVEDILLGFLFGGIAAVIYESFFKKTVKSVTSPHPKSFYLFAIFTLVACAVLFSVFDVNSFTAIISALIMVSIIILSLRRDLVRSSLYSGFLTLLISIPFYILAYFVSPEWAAVTYKFKTLSGVTLYGFPVEEFIFWLFYGFAIGPVYEYAKGWGFK